MTRLFLLCAVAGPLWVAACAPAPLYTSSGVKRGAATWGEIPRDARGEPVWSAIRPAPGAPDMGAGTTAVTPEAAGGRSTPEAVAAEGDAEGTPRPPKA
jgi:hypothetical protein